MKHDDVFQSLHEGGLLLLANCWDGGSARLAQAAGARALATSSASLAWANGYADGSHLPPGLLLQSVRGIARVSDLPLTVDIEDGYSDEPEQVASLVRELMDAGAVGINIEDGAGRPELLAR
jgi:2-methylisocitrate lyase-like PEP mutase family enzyme